MIKWILLFLAALIAGAVFVNYYQPIDITGTGYGPCHADALTYLRCAGGFWRGVMRLP